MLPDRLSADELEERLDEHLDAVLSSRRTAHPLAVNLANLTRRRQEFVLHWVAVIVRTNPELAYQFAAAAPDALTRMDLAAAESWIIQAMDAYDREGLHRGAAAIKDVGGFVERGGANASAVRLDDIRHVLELFLCGLSGRRLAVEAGIETYTDTATVYLPARISRFATSAENFVLYKAMAVHLWAQARYGTHSADIQATLASHADPEPTLAWFAYFETVRLDACIARTFPGLARQISGLDLGAGDADVAGLADLRRDGATASDSLALLSRVPSGISAPRAGYAGILRPDVAGAIREARLAREKDALRAALHDLLPKPSDTAVEDEAPRFTVERAEPDAGGRQGPFELRLDGKPVAPPDTVTDLIESIAQDLGEMPDEYLVPSEGGYRPADPDRNPADDVWKGVHHEEGAFLYDEWDFKRRHYRKQWCVLRELDVHPGDPDFVSQALSRFGPHIDRLRRSFEILRGEDRLLRRQKNGEDIDLDAVIAGQIDVQTGEELPEQLFLRRHRAERSMAVMFMVDMSGSTKGWINDAEREALIMLCEALEILGDRYAIYGFSGITRKRCEVFRVKRFDEPYGDLVRGRIAGITPQDYTRMGVAIRHLTRTLGEVDARTRLLVTLSDGKPDDYSDHYRGEYGIEDTRQALVEARHAGVHPFCITIDREARDYLPHMYGPANYVVIDDVGKLPLKVADIYRKLTT